MVDQSVEIRADSSLIHKLNGKIPGLALVTAIAGIATLVQQVTDIAALSPLIVAMVLGISYRSIFGKAQVLHSGLAFALRPVLRFAIILLGLQITLFEVAGLGWRGVVGVTITLVATFGFTIGVARLFGVERRLAELIAAGTSVCGASAIIACNTVTRGSDEDVAYAMGCVTLFGTLAMLAFPLLAGPLFLSAQAYGVWVGASVHEVAQVVGASFAHGEDAGHAGTVTKLTRVMLLAPLILSLGFLRKRGADSSVKVPTPWFVFGFILMMVLNTFITIPEQILDFLVLSTTFMLTAALAAMGLETDLRKLCLKGLRPLALGATASIFIAVVGLGMAMWATS